MEKNKVITKQYKNTKEKGDLYENYILAYLFESIPKCNAWLWSNIPEEVMCDVGLIGNWNEHRKQRKANRINKLPDIGCDIFMITPNNENHLVQCKYYAGKNHIKFEDIAGWSLMLVDNPEMFGDLYYTSKLSENLKARKPNPRINYIHKPYEEPVISNSKIETTKPSSNTIAKPAEKPIITLEYILNTSLELEVETEVPIPLNIELFSTFTLTPYDYQLNAYNALKDKQRTVLQLPCGMGKTLIAIMLASHYDLVIFISPLKAFCEQNMARFNEQLPEYHCNIIDSDGIRDIDKLQTILADDTCKHALFVTYKSVDIIMKLFDIKLLNNGYFIIDEFHNIPYDDAYNFDSEDEDYLDDDIESMKDDDISVEDEENEKHSDSEMESDSLCDDGEEDYLEEDNSESIEKVKTPMYRLLHSDARIMFMSATPRLFEESDETADGMDIDCEIFGEVDYSFPMGKAIEEGYICDYFVYVPTMAIKQDTGIEDVITELQVKDYNREMLVKSRFILRGCLGTGSRKCIIYCIEQEECNMMMNIIKDLCENYLAIDCWCDTITSNDSPEKRKNKLGAFKDAREIAFVCSVNILNECIDIPECDSIFITYASKSKIRNIQRLCRANRKDKKNPNKIASVFLWCDEYNQTAEFMKHVKEYDLRFTYERVKRVCSSDVENSGVMKACDSEKDKKDLDNVIIGYKGVSSWYEMLEKVKKFIDEHGKRPTPNNNKALYNWMSVQLRNYKQKIQIMKIDEIYNAWNNFINDTRYKKYFDLDNIRDWRINFDELKQFIDINNARPTENTNKNLCLWIRTQITNLKKKQQIMKNDEIYNLWNEFINDTRYKKYFDLDNIRDWKIKFEELKHFIDSNNSRPTIKTNKNLCLWISTQITNYKNKKRIMKTFEIYSLWNEFINDISYKQYFLSNEEDWKNKLKEVKNFTDTNNDKPTLKTNKNLCLWISTQMQNYKTKTNIMKTDEIYLLWNECINDTRYKKYFDLDNIRDWRINFDELKQFIDINNARPTENTNKELQKWLSHQITNYKNKKRIMKNNEIYTIWIDFINDIRYIKYFDLDNIRDWKIKLEDLKEFININNARPTLKTNKDLHIWISTQLQNYKKKQHSMKNDEIYSLWTQFITDSKYNKYFT